MALFPGMEDVVPNAGGRKHLILASESEIREPPPPFEPEAVESTLLILSSNGRDTPAGSTSRSATKPSGPIAM